MITSQDKELIARLIKKYAGNISTESMIAFVADTNGMLAICRTLVNSNNNDDQFTISWVDEKCHSHNVDVRGFLYEVEQVLSIFQPGHKINEHYATLELEDGASDEDIKNAYRRLSRKFHPDTASSDDPDNGDMFVRITKAYHALMEEDNNNDGFVQSSNPVNNWREQKTHHVSRERKKKNLFWFAALASVMIVISLVVAKKYREQAMIAGLQSSTAAFIPPASVIKVENEESEPVEKSIKAEITENEITTEEAEVPVEIVEELISNLNKTQFSLEIETEETDKFPEQDETHPVIEKVVTFKDSPPPKEFVQKGKSVEKKDPLEIVKEKPKEVVQQEKKQTITQPVKKQAVQKQIVVVPVQQKPAEPTEAEIQIRTQKKIEGFLYDYTKSYENKDLLSFTRFFDLDAKENGEALAEILPTYSDLFQKSDTIKLDILILKWNNSEDILQIDGRFKINIRYKTGDKVQGAGSISFLMREVEEQLSIKEISYQFDN